MLALLDNLNAAIDVLPALGGLFTLTKLNTLDAVNGHGSITINAHSNGLLSETLPLSLASTLPFEAGVGLALVLGAQVKGGDVSITSKATVTKTVSTLPVVTVGIGVALTLVLGGADIEGKTSLTVGSESNVSLTGTAGSGNGTLLGDGVALAVGVAITSATTIIAGSDLKSDGATTVSALNTTTVRQTADDAVGTAGVGAAVAVAIGVQAAIVSIVDSVVIGESVTVTSTSAGEVKSSAVAGDAAKSALDQLLADSLLSPLTTALTTIGNSVLEPLNDLLDVLGSSLEDKLTPLSPLLRTADLATLLGTFGDLFDDAGVSVGAAAAASLLVSTTTAAVADLPLLHATGLTATGSGKSAAVRAGSSTKSSATADASPFAGASGAAVGIAVNAPVVTVLALLLGNVSVTASNFTLQAVVDTDPALYSASTGGATGNVGHGAKATSGAGGTAVGLAGAIAVGISVLTVDAVLDGHVTSAGGDVRVKALTDTRNEVAAEAGASGIGSGLAAGISVELTTASLGLAADLTSVRDLEVAAQSVNALNTSAAGGASGGTGVGGAASAATSISVVTTTAEILGIAVPTIPAVPSEVLSTELHVIGSMTITATQRSVVDTTATARATASGAQVGATLALTLATHTVLATVLRDIDADTFITVRALSFSDVDGQSTAGAGGATAPAGGADPSSYLDVDEQIGQVVTLVDLLTGEDLAGLDIPSAKSHDGTVVTAAAAIAVTLTTTNVSAITGAGVDLDATGALTVEAKNETDSLATATATGAGGDAGAGTAVALNTALVTTSANVLDANLVTAGSLSVTAGMGTGGNSVHDLKATAKSGLAAAGTGLATGLAINLTVVASTATLDNSPARGPPGTALVSNAAAVSATSTTNAEARAEQFSSHGVGAAVALAIAANNTSAQILGAILSAGSVAVTATGTHTTAANAISSASGSGTLGGWVAVAVAVNLTQAGSTGKLSATTTGKPRTIVVSATATGSTTSTADGSLATAAAAGAAIALTIAVDKTTALLGGTASAGLGVDVLATSTPTSGATAKSGKAGAPSGADANARITALRSRVTSLLSGALPAVPALPALDPLKTVNAAGNVAIGAAAALGVDLAVVDTIACVGATEACVGAGVVVNGGSGDVRVRATTASSASSVATAASVAATAAVGLAASVTDAVVSTRALIGSAADVDATGVVVDSGIANEATGSSAVQSATSHATPGAATAGAGVAAGLSLTLTVVLTEALVLSGATVDAKTAALKVRAGATTTNRAGPPPPPAMDPLQARDRRDHRGAPSR